MMSLYEQKEALRGKVLAKRLEIAEKEWQEKSETISRYFTESELYKQASFIHCFVSMNDRNEVNTQLLINKMLSDGKEVAVPVTNFSDSSLIHSRIHSLQDLKPNKWGIHEPQEIESVDITALDLVLIPMAAADKKGNRLGYGKGFYDRFLSEITASKIGLVFDEFIFDEIPAEDFDIKMDMLISEKGIIRT